jgi:hypothetical protein
LTTVDISTIIHISKFVYLSKEARWIFVTPTPMVVAAAPAAAAADGSEQEALLS